MTKLSRGKKTTESVTEEKLCALENLLVLVNGLPQRPPEFHEAQKATDIEQVTRDYIFKHPSHTSVKFWGLTLSHERYQILLEAAKVLAALKEVAGGVVVSRSIPTATYWEVNGGKVDVTTGPVANVLRGVEIDRIRRCTACSRWFYARRQDKRACSTKCASLVRMRDKRSKAKYAINRSQKRKKR